VVIMRATEEFASRKSQAAYRLPIGGLVE